MAKKAAVKRSDMQMKTFIIIALIAAFVGGYLVARAKYKPQILELAKMVADKDSAMQKMKDNANKVVMKDGMMWMVEEGIVKSMDSDIMMPNGVKVMKDGRVITANGEEMMMKNGDAIDMEGNMMPRGGENIETGSPSF